jgi:hypothetical protein
MSEKFEVYADIPCRLVHNENGVFLVFANNIDSGEAANLFEGWQNIVCFGQYENALQLKERSYIYNSVALFGEEYDF